MPYDISKDYAVVHDGYGGARLIPRPHVQHAIDRFYQQRARTRDAALPRSVGNANPPVEDQATTKPSLASAVRKQGGDFQPRTRKARERRLGQLPALDAGYRYSVTHDADRFATVRRVVDDGGTIRLGDGSKQRSGAQSQQLMSQIQRRNDAFWNRSTKDRSTENTLIRHGPLVDGQRLEIRGPSEFGLYDLVLISDADLEIVGKRPPGIEELDGSEPEDDPRRVVGEISAPVEGNSELRMRRPDRTGDSTASKLRAQNAANKRYWAGRAA